MTSRRGPTQTAATGSTTTLETQHSPQGRLVPLIGTLRLRAEPAPRRGIRWAEDVVDNEGLGRKSSKGEITSLVPFKATPLCLEAVQSQ